MSIPRQRFPLSVTITGADDAVPEIELVRLAKRYPFVEFGILVSPKRTGSPRYPSLQWITNTLQNAARMPPMRVAIHMCGAATREAEEGDTGWLREIADYYCGAIRVQLNGYEATGINSLSRHVTVAASCGIDLRFILQARDAQAFTYLSQLVRWQLPTGAVLYDPSGGRGLKLEAGWPRGYEGVSTGYAGGITPETATAAYAQCLLRGGDWIDLESGVRTDDCFDLDKVRAVLDSIEQYELQLREAESR
jgi:hypothetical protein